MCNQGQERPSDENLRAAMQWAWEDHFRVRDQTWKALHVAAVFGAGLVTVDWQFKSTPATSCAAVLVWIASFFGILIWLNHQRVERRKFIHIMNCERMLGLLRSDVIPYAPDGKFQDAPNDAGNIAVRLPPVLSVWSAFDLRINNTSVLILRMHFAVMLFAALVLAVRCCL